eukprot:COSAG02_NODE_3877_length_6101_cov_2.939020_5_plen_71_part_00
MAVALLRAILLSQGGASRAQAGAQKTAHDALRNTKAPSKPRSRIHSMTHSTHTNHANQANLSASQCALTG